MKRIYKQNTFEHNIYKQTIYKQTINKKIYRIYKQNVYMILTNDDKAEKVRQVFSARLLQIKV